MVLMIFFKQTSSTDAISSNNQANTLLTDANGNTIPVVQVVSQPGATGLALPILQDSNGNRTRILHLQVNFYLSYIWIMGIFSICLFQYV